MPAAYQHLRVRLRIEQTRLLNWGQKVGLLEELLDQPSRTLQQNRNLIIDILLEIQALFKSCVVIEAKYDGLVPVKPPESSPKEDKFEKRFPKETNSILKKTLHILEKTPEVPRRLQWAIVKQNEFDSLIEKLIGYNNSIEALLDSSAIDQLQVMQQQTYMAMLQLNSNVSELTEISRAIQIKTGATTLDTGQTTVSFKASNESDRGNSPTSFAHLADFKVQQMQLDNSPSTLDPIIPSSQISLSTPDALRPEATYQSKRLWVEWKQLDSTRNARWNQKISDRIRKLALLLISQDKPVQFGAPQCVGYFNDTSKDRYGFLYLKPNSVPPTTKPISLLDLITTEKKPSLSKRITLAHAIARCLLYLHSVNWLHKGLRSNNIIFFTPPSQAPSYWAPIVAGFEYARPDYPEEETEPPREHSEHDIYRHPAVLSRASRSQKSHDIYSLGIVLVEIAYWQRIDKVMDMPSDTKLARSNVRKVRKRLREDGYLQEIEGHVGNVYAEAVGKCLTGGKELGVPEGANESDVEVGAALQAAFSKAVVQKLADITV
ncbi:hypothetical protein MMC28_001581 [Mycoblastus sanguinarius]|nr:hypothetical protein [Mycoblastus sanguinarius]